MRLFIAIPIPPGPPFVELIRVKEELQKIKGKITPPAHFHLTLKFLGDADELQLKKIKDRLKTITFNKFSINFDGIGMFPDEKNPRVIWMGLTPQDQVIALQKMIDDVLEDMFPKEITFVPHITLSRIKSLDDESQFNEVISAISCKPETIPVDRFALVISEFSGHGGRAYRDLDVYPAEDL